MENCIFDGKTLCTYDLKDDNGLYYEDLVLEWKQAAADRKLICTECGADVYLAAGPIKEPYFSHYDILDCNYGSSHESEEMKKGKRLLYQLLRHSFSSGDIQARFRMENGIYSTFYCILEDGRSYAVNYRLQNNSLEHFIERDSFYQVNKIIPIYVLGKRLEKDTKQIDWYQNLIQTSMGYLVFLDAENESITLKKSFSFRLGINRKYRNCIKTYPIRELKLELDGSMSIDFTKECVETELMIQEERQQYHSMQEQLKRMKEEKVRYEESELKKQESYRIQAQNAISENNQVVVTELNPLILEKCKKMLEDGNGHLVSRKYYEAIMRDQSR